MKLDPAVDADDPDFRAAGGKKGLPLAIQLLGRIAFGFHFDANFGRRRCILLFTNFAKLSRPCHADFEVPGIGQHGPTRTQAWFFLRDVVKGPSLW